MPTYNIQTFGCQMNYSDTERMETYLQALGYNPVATFDDADIVMFNTCSIRQKAEDKVLGHMRTMRAIKKTRPELMVVITGCMVRKSSSRYSKDRDDLLRRVDEIDIALRTDELSKLAGLVREVNPDLEVAEIYEEELEDYFQIKAKHGSHKSKAQAFVAISNGCDKFCTYCIVPYSRGREKSRKLTSIVEEVGELVKNGCKEVVLIGQTVNSYGLGKHDEEHGTFTYLEGKEPFVHLLEELDKFHDQGLVRVRFTSPHPQDMSDQLIEVMATLPTQMPYLHLPVQSGDDRTLRRMNRTYTTEQYREIVGKLREKVPGISVSSDVIVGFCGETDEEFETTMKFFDEMNFEHAFLAQYSERKGTTAAKFIKDDISTKVKKARWERINDLLRKNSLRAHQRFEGEIVHVLVEEQDGKVCMGRSEHYKTVEFESGRDVLGEIIPVRITKALEWMLEGEMA